MISGLVFFINTVWSYSTSTQEINQAPKCRSRNSFFTSFPKRNTSARKRTSDKGGKWIWLVTRRCDRPREIDPEKGNLFGKFVPRVPSLPSFSKDGGGRREGEMFLGTNLHERKSSSERSEKSSDSDDDFQSRGEKFKHSHRRHSFFRMDQEDQEVLCALNLLVTYLLQLNN